jgi:hypothetical protein
MHCVCATLELPAGLLKPFCEQGFDDKQLFNQKASRLSLSEQSIEKSSQTNGPIGNRGPSVEVLLRELGNAENVINSP